MQEDVFTGKYIIIIVKMKEDYGFHEIIVRVIKMAMMELMPMTL